jgi:ubiquinol-cytochrome c reductase iron-sulfur subunit
MRAFSSATTGESMSQQEPDQGKRRFLLTATTVASGVAAGAAAVPFVASMLPSERAKAAGAPVEVDVSGLEPGQKMIVEWRGKPVWVVRRTPDMLKAVKADDERVADPESKRSQQPEYAKNEMRSLKPEYLVVVGICTHLGCSPVDRLAAQPEPFASDWRGGFYCPCHGSLFDLAGRVYKNKPAPDNLAVPPYKFVTDTKLVIGEDTKGA